MSLGYGLRDFFVDNYVGKNENIPSEKVYNIEFNKKITAHYFGGVICEMLNLDILKIKGIYDSEKREYLILEKKYGNYFPIFSITFSKRRFISPSRLENKIALYISDNIEIRKINSFLEEIKCRVNSNLK